MSAKIGKFSKLYTGGEDGNSYTEIKIVTDVSIPVEWTTARLAHRGTDDALYGAVDREVTLEFTLVRDVANTQYTALRDAFLAKTILFLEAATGDRAATGTEIASGEFILTGWSVSEPLADFDTVAVTARLAAGAETPGLTLETVSE